MPERIIQKSRFQAMVTMLVQAPQDHDNKILTAEGRKMLLAMTIYQGR